MIFFFYGIALAKIVMAFPDFQANPAKLIFTFAGHMNAASIFVYWS